MKRLTILVTVTVLLWVTYSEPKAYVYPEPTQRIPMVYVKPKIVKPVTPRQYAKRQIVSRNQTLKQYKCLVVLWDRESSWNHKAENPHSGAYGIPQALPADKMAVEGKDWRTNFKTQIDWGLRYIKSRYGNPCGAWRFWRENGWY